MYPKQADCMVFAGLFRIFMPLIVVNIRFSFLKLSMLKHKIPMLKLFKKYKQRVNKAINMCISSIL